jgi:23S rRNA (uracil1939-C5)-methyltransferase
MARRRSRRARIPETVFTGQVEDLAHDGRGVVRQEGKTVFVSGALPGEHIHYQLTDRTRKFDVGKVVSVEQPSADRVVPRCEHFGVCGGCALQHMDPAAQIAAKQNRLLENFRRVGHIEPETPALPPLLGPVWGYRRKARLSARYVQKKEKLLLGFREANGRFVADIEHCHVLSEDVGLRLPVIRACLEAMEGFDRIPQIEVAAMDNATALVVRHLDPLSETDLERLRQLYADTGFHVYLQSKGPDTVTALAPADSALHVRIDGDAIELATQPGDFLQVNAAINERMIERALDLLDVQPEHRVLDLFCGLGNFSLPLARRVAAVVGVEGEANMVARATANAQANGLENTEFHAADLREDHTQAAWAKQAYDRVLIDPPRSGAIDALGLIAATGAKRLVYVSCDPATLARDAGELVREHGFALREWGVMDMFPHTHHVESIAVFSRN